MSWPPSISEQEWLDPAVEKLRLFWFLGASVTRRKRHLMDSACWRRVVPLLSAETRDGIALSERYADGEVTTRAFREAYVRRKGVISAGWDGTRRQANSFPLEVPFPDRMTRRRLYARMSWVLDVVEGLPAGFGGGLSVERERRFQRELFHEMFRNPFRPVAPDPAWMTDAVVDLARTAYDGLAFEVLPIVADVLQDAGCENADILSHCRDPGPHIRGCWVVDLLLGKE